MNWKSEQQKEDIKLSIYLNYSCSLHAEYLWYIRKDFLTNIQLPMVLYVLHQLRIFFLKLVIVTIITYKHFVWSSSLAIKSLNFLCMCGQCQRQTTWLSQTWILSILQKQKQHVSVMGSNTWLNMGLMPFHIYAYNGVWLWYISLPVKWQEQSNCSCPCIRASQMITLLWFCKIYVSTV